MPKILVVDDDPSFNKMLTVFLNRNNYESIQAHSAKSALESMSQNDFDLVLTDFKLPDLDGLELIERFKTEKPDMPVILMTNYKDIRTAVKSIQLGAFEFVTKPVNPDELLLLVKEAIKSKSQQKDHSLQTDNQKTKNTPSSSEQGYIKGSSEIAQKIWQHIELVAPTKMSVLILGESGTGKEYAAKMVHSLSSRSNENFYALDCGALSKELAASELFGHVKGAFTGALYDKQGAFEKAHKGTLFLDEVGNLSYDVQVQLLRALQERKIRRIGSDKEITVDVRVIAATNENLSQTHDEAGFRQDLYHRLNEFSISLPALRERNSDLKEFIQHFVSLAANELDKPTPTLTDETESILLHYHWPGNLRELRNIIRRAVLLSQSDQIEASHLPEDIRNPQEKTGNTANEPFSLAKADLKEKQRETEKEMIERVLKETKYNKSRTAAILNIDRKTLYNKIKQYGIES